MNTTVLRWNPRIASWCVYLDNRLVFISESYDDAWDYHRRMSGVIEVSVSYVDEDVSDMFSRWYYHCNSRPLGFLSPAERRMS